MTPTTPTPLSKRWHVAPRAPKDFVAHVNSLQLLPTNGKARGNPHWMLTQLLYNRGITNPGEVERFLDPAPPLLNPLQSPKLKGLDQAVARLRRAIRQQEPIAVYGDYDADGVTATALLVETLEALGAKARPYIPDRVDEGYGLNTEALAKLRQAGTRLVVTVDCGVRSIDEIAYARRIGLDVVVTDHHHTADEIPPAVACLNPKQPGCPYPFKDLAGVGLAFRLAQALLAVEQRMSGRAGFDPASLLDLVALGTVADMVPLLGENRALVLYGLASLNQPARPGLRALMDVAGVKPGTVDANAIGFRLGPRLNAAGRLEDAMAAYRLLVTRDEAEAQRLAEELNEQNRERQRLTNETHERARELALAAHADEEEVFLLFAAAPDFLAGVVGLAAARLVDEFYRPAVVVEQSEEESRGSCRSIPEFHITQALDQCTDLMVRHGGHAAAAGFTVRTENLERLAARLHAIAEEQLSNCDLRPALPIDCELSLDELNLEVFHALQQLEPCGYGNPTPLLGSRAVQVVEARAVGREDSHLKLRLCSGETRFTWDAIAFRQGHHAEWLQPGMPVDVAYSLEENEWNGEKRLQIVVHDLRPAE